MLVFISFEILRDRCDRIFYIGGEECFWLGFNFFVWDEFLVYYFSWFLEVKVWIQSWYQRYEIKSLIFVVFDLGRF